MEDSFDYWDIYVHKRHEKIIKIGRVKICDQGIIFKSQRTGKVEHFLKGDVDEIDWQRLPTNYSLKVALKNGNLFRFMGFQEMDFKKLRQLIENSLGLFLNHREPSQSDLNWAMAALKGTTFSFEKLDSKPSLEIPSITDSLCTSVDKKFTPDICQSATVDCRVQSITDNVSNDVQSNGNAIVTFNDLQCLTPYDRYDIKIFSNFIHFVGKTFDYKIPLTVVIRIFRLPYNNDRGFYFVLKLNPPIEQGKVRYRFIILLFNKGDETSLELNITDKELSEKYENKLEKKMAGPTYDVLGQIMKVLVQREIVSPGITGPRSKTQAVFCSYRDKLGFLYPLEKGFICINELPVHVEFDEISFICFVQDKESTWSFNFEVETKLGVVHSFSYIRKGQYSKLYNFAVSKKLRVENRGTEVSGTTTDDNDHDSDEGTASDAQVEHEDSVEEEEADDDDDDDEEEEEEEEDEDKEEEECDSDVSSGAGENDEVDFAEEFDSKALESSSSENSEASPRAKRRKHERKAEEEEEEETKEEEQKSKSKKRKSEIKSIDCNYRNESGSLQLRAESLFYSYRPLNFDKILSAIFVRSRTLTLSLTQLFDLKVTTKKKIHTFSFINGLEYSRLCDEFNNSQRFSQETGNESSEETGSLYSWQRDSSFLTVKSDKIKFDEILSFKFMKDGGDFFDFEVETNSGVSHTFKEIEIENYSILYDFVAQKKNHVKIW